MSRRFDYVKYDKTAADKQAAFKSKFEELEKMAYDLLPDGRNRNLFLVAIEQAYMWTGKAIRDEQIARNPASPDEPARGAS